MIVDPSRIHDLRRVGAQAQCAAHLGQKHIHHLMFDQAIAHIGLIFQMMAEFQEQPGDPQFFVKAAHRASAGVFLPVWVGAAGIGPKPRRVVFAQGAALQQDIGAANDKYRNGLVLQAFLMRPQLVHRSQRAVYPCRDVSVHSVSFLIGQRPCCLGDNTLV